MKKKPFGKTIRQELVDAAALKLRLWSYEGDIKRPSDATASVLDGVRPGTLGERMLAYALALSEVGWRRLEREIERKAK